MTLDSRPDPFCYSSAHYVSSLLFQFNQSIRYDSICIGHVASFQAIFGSNDFIHVTDPTAAGSRILHRLGSKDAHGTDKGYIEEKANAQAHVVTIPWWIWLKSGVVKDTPAVV